MWTEWAKPQAKQAQGLDGQSNSLAGRQVSSRFGPRLRGQVSPQEEEG
jgi:hypothetical protein